MSEIVKDKRFSNVTMDADFLRIPKNVQKNEIDNRFKGIFKNKKLAKKCRVNERGRALDLHSTDNHGDENSSEDDEKVDPSNTINKVSKKRNKTKRNFNIDCNSNKSDHSNKALSRKDKKQDISKKVLNPISDPRFQLKIELDEEPASKNVNKKRNKIKKEIEVDNEGSSLEDNKIMSRKSRKSSKSPQIASSNQNNKFNNEDEGIKLLKNIDDPRFQIQSESSEESSSSGDGGQKTTKTEEDSEKDSSSSDEESDSSETGDTFDHHWEEQQDKAPETNEITKRLAVCSMDWDRIRAIDLFTVFNSFKPQDSSIISVKIFPSEYGLKRMEEEKLKGPPELVEKTLNSDEEEDLDDKKGGRYNREKLRQYQLNRLKYYYAVVECDTPETANTLYDHLNGMEYESSSVRFDLRFIPDDMTFDQEPTSVAENPDLTEYKPNLFVTTALQQVKVGLTWDETDPQRREIFQRAFTEPDDIENDIKEYLASSSEGSDLDDEIEDEEEGKVKLSTQERIQKYKALLESLNEQEKEKNEEKYEMEITWEPGVKEKTETLVKEKIEEQISLTPFEELKKKKKEKQKMKKKEKNAKNQVVENSESDDSSISIESKTENFTGEEKKSKKKDELNLSTNSKTCEENNKQKWKKKTNREKIEEELQDELNLYTNSKTCEENNKQKLKKKAKREKIEEELQDELNLFTNSKTYEENNKQKWGKKAKREKIKEELQDELYLFTNSKPCKENNKQKWKKKAKREKIEEELQVDINDPRFSAIYTSPLYNIDPSDPHFKRTPGNLAIIAEKQRRLKKRSMSSHDSPHKKFKSK